MARRSIRRLAMRKILGSKANLLLFVFVTLALALFLVAALLQNNGTFTIMTTNGDMLGYGLVLSDTRGFERPRAKLQSAAVKNMWNITQSQLPKNIDSVDAAHNGADYLAYTFYVKNDGHDPLEYQASIDITDMHLAVDEAMRVKLYLNGVPTVYAKQKSDGSGKPEPGTTPFVGTSRIISLDFRPLKIGAVDKYTVVCWLEGEDPDCVNSILGGSVKMTMRFTAKLPKATSAPKA